MGFTFFKRRYCFLIKNSSISIAYSFSINLKSEMAGGEHRQSDGGSAAGAGHLLHDPRGAGVNCDTLHVLHCHCYLKHHHHLKAIRHPIASGLISHGSSRLKKDRLWWFTKWRDDRHRYKFYWPLTWQLLSRALQEHAELEVWNPCEVPRNTRVAPVLLGVSNVPRRVRSIRPTTTPYFQHESANIIMFFPLKLALRVCLLPFHLPDS